MKKLIIVFFSLISSFYIYGQHRITGTVTDANGQALGGVEVYSKSLHIGTTTDSDGVFTLNLPKGQFTLNFSMVGYRKVSVATTDTRHTYNVKLEAVFNQLNEVVVTGVTQATSLKSLPVSIATINTSEIQSQPGFSDILKSVPGFDLLTTGPVALKPVIRGLGYNRVLTLYNGVRQEYQQWGAEHGIEIEETGTSRIEVIKGPAALLYGSDAVGGVVNFITEEQLKQGELNGFFKSQYQTNSKLQEYAGEFKGKLGMWGYKVDFSNKRAAAYKNDKDGRVFNSQFKNTNFSGDVSANYNHGNTKLFVSRFDRKLGITEGDRDEKGRFVKTVVDAKTHIVDEVPVSDKQMGKYKIDFPYQPLTHFSLQLEQNIFYKNNKIKLDLGYQNNLRREFGLDKGQKVNLNALPPALYMKMKTYTYNGIYYLPSFGTWKLNVGLNGIYQVHENAGKEAVIPNYNLFTLGAFAYCNKHLNEKLDFAGGLRYDFSNVKGKSEGGPKGEYEEAGKKKFQDFTKDYNNLNGSLGLTYALNDYHTLKANVSTGFRRPNFEEMAAKGVHEGTARYELGNRDLSPEKNVQFDLEYIGENENLTFDLSGFHNAISDFIYVQKNRGRLRTRDGLIAEKGGVEKTYYEFTYGQKDARIIGAEAYIDIHPQAVSWLHWKNSLTLVDAQFKRYNKEEKNNKYVSFIPPAKLKSEIKANFKPNKMFGELSVSFGVDRTFKQDRVYTLYDTESATKGYTLFNASVGAFFKNEKGNTVAKLFIVGDNLLDKAYQNHLSRLKYVGVYSPGRNVSLKLIIPFAINL